MEKTSQTKAIIEYLISGHSITPIEALRICGSMRLSARIYDIKEKGYNVITDYVIIQGKRVARYKIGK